LPSTLGYALLGLLARRPRTGYELSQALRDPIGFFWTASHSQVYPELARLQAEGLVRHRVIDGPGPRDTKQYWATPAGRQSLGKWAARPPQPHPARDESLLKVYSLWTADRSAARALLEATLSAHRTQLALYTEFEQSMRAESAAALADAATPEFSSHATLRRGLSFERHAIAWCEWLVDALDGGTP
jgi:DNA-binding PadR family transcriptional regulator